MARDPMRLHKTGPLVRSAAGGLSRTRCSQDSDSASLREGIPARVGARTDSRTSTRLHKTKP